MRVRGRAAAGVLAAGMALTLVAAESAPATPQGTAQTSMFGADIRITNLPEVGELGGRLMDLTTFATTVDGAFARTAVIPLTLPDGSTPGAIEARSDGNTSGSTELASLGDLEGLLGMSVNPISTTAQAGTTSAVASIQAAVAELAALTEAIGVDITTPGITSIVGNTGAIATQGVQVSELELNLAALGLVSGILEQLGIDQVLALLNGFGFGDDVDVEALNGLLAEIDAIQSELADELVVLDGLLDSIAESVDEVGALNGLLEGLSGLSVGDLLDAMSLLAALAELDCELDLNLLNLSLVSDAIACVTAALDDVLDVLALDLSELLTVIESIEDLVADFGLELDGLDGLLESILGLLDGLASTPLLGVSAFDVGVVATATDSVDTSSATVLCNEIDVTVLTQTFATPSCAEGLSVVAGVAGQVTGAVTGVTSLLESALPIEGLSGLTFDVFANLVQDVSEVDGVVTATAGLDLVDLVIPSLSLDPDLLTDPLDLGGLTGILDDVVVALNDVLGLLGDLGGVGELVDVVNGILDVVEGGEVDGLLDEVDALIGLIQGLLGDLPFGTLAETIVTPGIALTIDPTSTASFQAAAPVTPGAPDPEDTPELPVTGGSLALLGLLAISGAAAMRRRRN